MPDKDCERYTRNTIVIGDALQELSRLPDSSFAVIITSPPYNMGVSNPAHKAGKYRPVGIGRWYGNYAGFDDAMPTDIYVDYHSKVIQECLRVLKDDGILWYVHRRRSQFMPTGALSLVDSVLTDIPVRAEIIWDKCRRGVGFSAAGHTRGAYYPTPSYETIFMLAKSSNSLLDRAIAAQGDIWRIPRDKRMPEHPAPFPVELAYRCITATLSHGDVLDPFMGVGSTAIAAIQAGRDWLGIEQADAYVDKANERIMLAQSNPVLL